MTTAGMRRVWDWMAARLVDPPAAPKFKVSLFFLPLGAHGIYRNGVLIVRPWASRLIVIHEACHHLWVLWNHWDFLPAGISHTLEGDAFLQVIGQGYWDERAIETWCATLTAILVDLPGVWRQPISGAMPCKGAVWTFSLFLKET